MAPSIGVIMPAYKAQDTIGSSVRSVLAQSYSQWQLLIIADDGADYGAILAQQGIVDPRITFLSSGQIGGGAARARNVALEALGTDYGAILDADDRFKPDKLALGIAALADYPIVSTALDVMDTKFAHLRLVGHGQDQVLNAGRHKWINLSMDSMVMWDRRRADGRYDPSLSNMTDLEFLLQLYHTAPASYHLGAPLHDYIKRAGSMSNSAAAKTGMIAAKTTLLARLAAGYYPLATPDDLAGMQKFLEISLAAERTFLASDGALFEDHLEPLLSAQPSKNGAAP